MYGDNIFESSDYSKLSKSHKTKTDKKFKFIDISYPQIKKYINNNEILLSKYNTWIKLNKVGEIAVCTNDNKYAGHAIVGTIDKSKGVIGSLFVDYNYRGRGLSNKLLEDAINKYGGIELGVYADNAIAIKLYENHGFVKIREYYYENELVYVMRLKEYTNTL